MDARRGRLSPGLHRDRRIRAPIRRLLPATRYVAIARTSTWRARPMKSSACWKRRCARCRPPASNMWRSGRHIRRTASSNRKTSATRFSSASQTGAITKPWLSYCLGHLANQHRGRIVSELTTLPQFAGLIHAESYYQEALAGGLGEAPAYRAGAAACAPGRADYCRRRRRVVYLFANPAVCHHIAGGNEAPCPRRGRK